MSLDTKGEMNLVMGSHMGNRGEVKINGSTSLTYLLTDDEADQVFKIMKASHLRIVQSLISEAIK